VRGLVAGVWRYGSGNDVECIETSCKAQGYPECTFLVGSRNDLEKKHLNLVKEQL
jgi:predicted hydrocarbon binding protein